MALPRSLVRLRWLLVAVPPAVTAAALAVPGAWLPRPEPAAAQSSPTSTAPPSDDAATVRARPPVLASSAVEPTALAEPRPRAPDPVDVAADVPAAAEPDADPEPVVPERAPLRRAGREIFYGPSDSNRVALTFDDGPSAELTPWVLNTLRRHDVQATFFVLGNRASAHPELLQAIDAAGHEIGNHGWSHRSLRSMFPEQIEQEIDDTNAAVTTAIGKTPTLFRPPFGRYPPSSVPLVADRAMDLVLWNADGRDWDGDADAIVERVLSQARPGAIILLHDRETATARALPRILEGLARKGLSPVPVSELTPPAGPATSGTDPEASSGRSSRRP